MEQPRCRALRRDASADKHPARPLHEHHPQQTLRGHCTAKLLGPTTQVELQAALML